MQLRKLVKDAGAPVRAEIHPLTPESRNQRKYLMGGLIPLIVYMDGNDYRDTETKERYFDFLKKEFTPELLKINGKIQTFGKSSKGSKALNNFIGKIQDFLNDEYGISYDNPAVNPATYNNWIDTISMDTTDNFIEYCVKMKYINEKVR